MIPKSGSRFSVKIMLKIKNLPKPRVLVRMLFCVEPSAAYLGTLVARLPARSVARLVATLALALCLAGPMTANAAETVPIKRASPEAFRPSIVRDAVEAADWMAKSLAGWG